MEEQTAWTRRVGVVFFLLITVTPKLHGVGRGIQTIIFVVQQRYFIRREKCVNRKDYL
jgi:hypothetical protein